MNRRAASHLEYRWRHEAHPTAPPQARRTWVAVFGDVPLPIFGSGVEWTTWAQKSIDETEAEVLKV